MSVLGYTLVGVSMLAVVALSVTFVVVVVVVPDDATGVPRAGGPMDPNVDLVRVEATLSPSGVGGQELLVDLEVDVDGDMPHVAPSVEVRSRCTVGGRALVDDDQAFFMSLNGARDGARLIDVARMHRVHTLPASPEQCELSLQMTGAGARLMSRRAPVVYCYHEGTTTPGRCS